MGQLDKQNAVRTPERVLADFVPEGLEQVDNPQKTIPQMAKNASLCDRINSAVSRIPTSHTLARGDARHLSKLETGSVDLIMTSPPYWNLKEYNSSEGQLGNIASYEEFVTELEKVWHECYRALVPGGRLICVVGDVCLSRREHGRHAVMPLHASIQESCQRVGFDNLAPILWHKIANASYEVSGGAGFYGKPYEPNAVVKNDVEFILMQRKPGGYRQPSLSARLLSIIPKNLHRKWFQQIWTDVPGASTDQHPAPYPLPLAGRLIRMFSFVGDVVLDPFMGLATTNMAAAKYGRNSLGIEIDPVFFKKARSRLTQQASELFSSLDVSTMALEDVESE